MLTAGITVTFGLAESLITVTYIVESEAASMTAALAAAAVFDITSAWAGPRCAQRADLHLQSCMSGAQSLRY